MKFNEKTRGMNVTVNNEGTTAYTLDSYNKLYTMAATCMFGEPKFYGDTTAEIISDARKMIKTDPKFVLQLAVFLREDLYLRSVPVALLVEVANLTKGNPESKKDVYWASQRIITRADQITELLAYQLHYYKKPVPNSLKDAMAIAFDKFNEYELAKYDRDGKVKLKDAMCIAHPRPVNAEQAGLFKRVLERTLKTPETWEVEISTKGSTKESWERIAPKMGHMAVLRNLRNFLEKGVDSKLFIDKVKSEKDVLNGKQFPFRYFSAYREIQSVGSANTSGVLEALEEAMDVSVTNVPKLKGVTLLSADHSGSMQSPLSSNSKIQMKEIADIMMAIANRSCEKAITSVFGDEFKVFNVSKRSVLGNMKDISVQDVGCSTNGFLTIQYLLGNKIKVDRVILFTDCELWDSVTYGSADITIKQLWDKYVKEINPDAYIYLINLNGSGTAQFPIGYPNTVNIAGWNEGVLNFIPLYEESGTNAINKIKEIKF